MNLCKKIRCYKKVSLFSLLFILTVFTSISTAQSETKRQVEKATITLSATSSGTPITGASFRAENFQIVYEKIKNGSFTKEDIDSSRFIGLKNQYDVKNGVVTLSNELTFGRGIRNTSQKSQGIIEILYNSKQIDFLQTMNEDSLNSPLIFKFHTPGIAGRFYTNDSGKAEATVDVGMTAILSPSNQLIKLVDVTKETKAISVDTINQDSEIKVDLTNVPRTEVTKDGYTIVEYGERLDYQVTIKKEFLNSSTTLHIQPNPNIVIDKISQPFTIKSNIPKELDATQFGAESGKMLTLNGVSDNIIQSFSRTYINTYEVTIPESNKDFQLNITAHLAPSVTLERELTNLPQIATPQKVTLDFSDVTPTVNKPNGTISQGKVINFIAENDKTGDNINYQTSNIRTTGINFVTINAETNVLATDANYFLGKIVSGEKYLYSSSGWKKVSTLKNINDSSYTKISGGKIQVLNLENSLEIPLNTAIWSFNAKEQNKINESLIEIRGLAKGVQYFLYEPEQEKIKQFKVSEDSLKRAENQSFTFNGKIPGYSAGIQEYNAISVNSNKIISYSFFTKIVLPILLFVLLIIIITALFLWKG